MGTRALSTQMNMALVKSPSNFTKIKLSLRSRTTKINAVSATGSAPQAHINAKATKPQNFRKVIQEFLSHDLRQPNPALNSDPACIVIRSLSTFVFLGFA